MHEFRRRFSIPSKCNAGWTACLPSRPTRRSTLDRAKIFAALQASIRDGARNGALIRRTEPGRHPAYAFRFRAKDPATGAVRQRSIALGNDPVLLEAAGRVVAIHRHSRERRKATKVQQAEQRQRARTLEAEVMQSIPGSRRYRQAVRRTLRQQVRNVPDLTSREFLACAGSLVQHRRRPGRPYRPRLW